MASLCKELPPKTFKIIGENSAPGLDKFLKDVSDCWKSNPDFQSGLQVALIKAAIAKSKSGNNAKLGGEGAQLLSVYEYIR